MSYEAFPTCSIFVFGGQLHRSAYAQYGLYGSPETLRLPATTLASTEVISEPINYPAIPGPATQPLPPAQTTYQPYYQPNRSRPVTQPAAMAAATYGQEPTLAPAPRPVPQPLAREWRLGRASPSRRLPLQAPTPERPASAPMTAIASLVAATSAAAPATIAVFGTAHSPYSPSAAAMADGFGPATSPTTTWINSPTRKTSICRGRGVAKCNSADASATADAASPGRLKARSGRRSR